MTCNKGPTKEQKWGHWLYVVSHLLGCCSWRRFFIEKEYRTVGFACMFTGFKDTTNMFTVDEHIEQSALLPDFIRNMLKGHSVK